MKALFAALTIFITMNVFAQSVSPKALLGLESRILNQKIEMNQKLNAANTDDLMEGKILAALGNMISDKLEQAEKEIAKIDSEEELTAANIAKIEKLLDEADQLINEI